MNLTTKNAEIVLFLKDEDMFHQIYELDTLRLFLVILSSVLTLLSILGALFATLFLFVPCKLARQAGVFAPGRPFHPSIMFVSKERAYPSEASFRCSTLQWVLALLPVR